MATILKNALARLSLEPLPAIELVHKETKKVLESLPIRLPCSSDRSFILSTWVKSYAATARKLRTKVTDDYSCHIPADVYEKEEPTVAESRWQDGLVVGDTGDEFTIHAWICGTNGRLWHVYVPPDLRNIGMATELIRFCCGQELEYAKPWPYRDVSPFWCYNPYLQKPKSNG